jgi:hypothetical protein
MTVAKGTICDLAAHQKEVVAWSIGAMLDGGPLSMDAEERTKKSQKMKDSRMIFTLLP